MAFFQAPPELGNQFSTDRVLRDYLDAALPADMRRDIDPELTELGDLAGGELYQLQLADRLNEPKLIAWDPWGHRVDKLELTPLWQRAKEIAVRFGLVATPYERKHGRFSRIHQFAKVYLFDPSTDVYTCPLAMSDGAAATLSFHGGAAMERALPRLTSRDPKTAWTSGQWMTERTGGSDVGLTETRAVPDAAGGFRLHGTKWFSSATMSEMALTLARPEGNPAGGRGLALFYLELAAADGSKNGVFINRLKDKLGTRKVPTAELTLDGALAHPVAGTSDGIRNITPMLNVTRTWNAVAAVSGMRRSIALARDYAVRRSQFGDNLAHKPLHVDTLAWMQSEYEAAFHFAFFGVELMGKLETKEITEREERALRLVTPLIKLSTAKQTVAVVSEALECFGGAGYIEDTGLPRLLRDAQVLPIWEGTTNVLSLDALRAIAREGALEALVAEGLDRLAEPAAELADEAALAKKTFARAVSWFGEATRDLVRLEGDARRFALTLARTMELSLLVAHASRASKRGERRPTFAAKRFAAQGIDLLDQRADDAKLLAMDLA